MHDMKDMLQMGLKVVFYFIIPAVVIYFRIKKKIKTGFAVGILMLSFILGVLFSASFQQDPVEQFMNNINNNSSETKKSLKILIQYGPEYLHKIDENKIIYPDVYKKLKDELIYEYSSIAEDYYNKYSIEETGDCSEYVAKKNIFENLLHGMKLIEYSESIGGRHEELKKRLAKKIENSKEIIDIIEKKCD